MVSWVFSRARLGRGGTSWKCVLFPVQRDVKVAEWLAVEAKRGERVTHVLQEGQVEPLCTTVKLSMISVNLTACWKLKPPLFPLFSNDPSQTRGRGLQEELAASQELAWSTS